MPRRIVHTAYCCGACYRRWIVAWRYYADAAHRQWSGNHHTHCGHCGQQLRWRGPGRLTAQLRRYRREREKNLLLGLTAAGSPRRRPRLTPEQRRAHNLDKYRRRAAAFRAAGLTSRGTPPRRFVLGLITNPIERAWRDSGLSLASPSSPA